MLLLLRPWKCKCEWNKQKCCCCGKQNNRGASQGEASQSKINDLDVNFSCEKAVLVCLIPSLVRICLCFIDGDYLACGVTDWSGHYACDKQLHPNCLNWCKPNDLRQGKKETEHKYEKTRNWIAISKTTGYALAIIFCFIAIIIVLCECKSGKSTSCGSTDPENQSHGQQDPGPANQPEQHNTNPLINREQRSISKRRQRKNT